jgi:hypothetical protein
MVAVFLIVCVWLGWKIGWSIGSIIVTAIRAIVWLLMFPFR